MKSLIRNHVLLAAAVLIGACGFAVSDEERLARAEQEMAAGNYRTASIELRNILASNPDNAEARIGLARVSLGLGEILDAEKEIRRAADLGAPPEEIRPIFVQVLLALGQFTEVLAALSEDAAGMTDSEVAEYRGAALFALGSYEAAEETYREWLATSPDESNATVGLARVLANTGRREAAIVELQNLLGRDDTDAAAWSALGRIQFRAGGVRRGS